MCKDSWLRGRVVVTNWCSSLSSLNWPLIVNLDGFLQVVETGAPGSFIHMFQTYPRSARNSWEDINQIKEFVASSYV